MADTNTHGNSYGLIKKIIAAGKKKIDPNELVVLKLSGALTDDDYIELIEELKEKYGEEDE